MSSARIIIILINIVGWGALLALGSLLQWNVPEWIAKFGFLNVAATVLGIMLAIIGVTYLVEFRIERRK